MASKTKLFMGIPSTGSRVDCQNYALREIEENYKDQIEFVYPEKCVQRIFHDFARNGMIEEFLDSECDIIWFLDSDVVPPKHVLDLITLHGKAWKLAGAPYPLWMTVPGGDAPTVVYSVYNGIKDEPGQRGILMAACPHSGTAMVDALATGCLFIKREVFKEIKKPYFEFKFDQESRQLSEGEDLGFALKMHKLGHKFFVDYSMVCKHYKNVDLLEIQNYATDWSNAKLIEYDKEIRGQSMSACEAAYIQGKIDAAKELKELASRSGPRKTESGLILPSGF